jgi:hypothetical protein
MMSDNIARNMLSSEETMEFINCPTQLHLVGHFYKTPNTLQFTGCDAQNLLTQYKIPTV